MKHMDPYHDDKRVHSQDAWKRGPLVAQDQQSIQNNTEFVTDTLPLRKVHTKGWGASGYFETTDSMKYFTKLSFLQNQGQRTDVRCRFSYAVSNPGTPDTARNVRALSIKFSAADGIYDSLNNAIPVFSVWDGAKFPEAIEAFLPSPQTNLINPDRFWAFVARNPESMMFVTYLYSDYGTAWNLRKLEFHSVNTYTWVNQNDKRYYVKYHWLPAEGLQTYTRQEAAAIADPNVAGQDIFDTIAVRKAPVQYQLHVQVMEPGMELKLPYDPLKCTYIWNEEQFPLMKVGTLVLNKTTDNYEEEVEKLQFRPTNMIDGVEPSNDPMLQMRTSGTYESAQRHRLGNDFIPTEQYIRGGILNNREQNFTYGNFDQPRELYNNMSDMEREHLMGNVAVDLVNAKSDVQKAVLDHFSSIDPSLAQGISRMMKR